MVQRGNRPGVLHRFGQTAFAIVSLTIASTIAAADQPFDVTVTAKSTPVMAGAKPIGEVQNGTRLTVTQTNGDWYLVDLPDANPPQRGWIRKGDVQSAPAAATTTAAPLTSEQQEQLKQRDKFKHEAKDRRDAGNFDEAIAPAEKTLAIERTVLGNDSSDALSSLTLLATLYEAKEDFATARKLREEVLAAKTKQLGKDHWQTTDARLGLEQTALLEKLDSDQRRQFQEAERLNGVVENFCNAGQYANAFKPATQALEIRRKILGDRHPACAESFAWLGMVHQQLGDSAGAEPLFKKAVSIQKEALGERHPDYAANLNNLAVVYQNAGAYARAEPLLRQVMEIERVALGERNRKYTITLNNLATLYRETGEYAKAEPLYLQSLAIKKQLLGERHPSYVLGLSNLAALYQSMDDYAKAEPLCKQVLEVRKQTLGEKHPDYAGALNGLANVCRGMGDYARAEPLYRQALEITKEALGEKHPDYIAQLSNMGGLYQRMGDYARAEPFLHEALEIEERVLGKKHPMYAGSLNDLASLYYEMGDYAKAEPLCSQSLQITKQVLGDKSPSYATGLTTLANLYHQKADYAQAEPLYRQAVEIWQRVPGEKSEAYTTGLSNLAAIYKDMGDYAMAEPLYKHSLEIEKAVLGEKNTSYATGLSNLAAMYKDMGLYAQAEPLCKQALEIRKQALGEKHPEYALSLNNLAALYAEMGDSAKAEPLYRQALEIQKQSLGEKHPDYAKDLNNLATLYKENGDYARSESLCKQALEIQKQTLGEKHPDYATSLNILADLYQTMGDYPRAEPLFRQALQIRKDALGEKHPDYATSLNDLALLYTYMDDNAKAAPLYRQALEIDKQVLGEKHSAYTKNLNNLSLMYYGMGDYAQAEALCKQALEIEKETLGEKHPDYENSLNSLASIYYTVGDNAKAAPLAYQALRLSRERLDLMAGVQSERQQLRMAEAVRIRLDDYLTLAKNADLPTTPVYAEVLAWKGAVTARQQAMRHLGHGQENPQAAELYQQLADTARQLDSLSRATPKPGQAESHRQRLEQLSEELETREKKLAAVSADFHRQLDERQRTPDDLRRVLPKDTVLVDLLEYHNAKPGAKRGAGDQEARIVAFIVRSDQPVKSVYLGLVDPIEADIAEWRRTVGAGRAAGKTDPGGDLRHLVWDQLQPYLQGAKTILISPDGVTARFPWLALPGEKPDTYLIDDVAIAIVPVPRMLPEMFAQERTPTDPSPQAAASLLLVGDVDFGADPGKPPESAPAGLVAPNLVAARGDQPLHWQSLPGTRDEVAAIKTTFEKQFSQITPGELTGAAATKSAVRAAAGNYQYLHISTHGFFAPPQLKSALGTSSSRGKTGFGDLPLRQDVSGYHPDLLSGLVLAGANRPVEEGQEDGILTALEVSEMDLSHVSLATLSACETGLGQTAGGEGLLGLQRAFQLAGAKSTVASLWQVPDRATQALMSRFYENLWRRRMPKLAALREAQQWLIHEAPKQPELLGRGLVFSPEPDKVQPQQPGPLSPFYWAAFVLSGDWR